MQSKPKASTIIACYNAGQITEDAAEQLSRKHYRCELAELDEHADVEDEEDDRRDEDEDEDDW